MPTKFSRNSIVIPGCSDTAGDKRFSERFVRNHKYLGSGASMLDYQNYIGRFERRHQELLKAAAEARRHRVGAGSRNGAWLLAVASALERISAAIRSRYPANPIQHATNTAAPWRTS